MSGTTRSNDGPAGPRSVLVGYDGSRGAATAIKLGARLLLDVRAQIVYLWSPPFASPKALQRLWRRGGTVAQLAAVVEREAAAEAERLTEDGVALARAAGWEAEPLVQRINGGEGLELARLAEQRRPAALVLGARGLSGVEAALGSSSDIAVHHSSAPVLVVPDTLLSEQWAAAVNGPIVVGFDGSSAARHALDTASELFAGRSLTAVTASHEDGSPVDPIAGSTADHVRVAPVGVQESGRAVADALARRAIETDAAAIVVGSRGRSAVREMLLGSVAMGVLHHAHRAVLVVPEPRHPETRPHS